MTEREIDLEIERVKSIIDFLHLDYDEAVTLGSVIGKFKSEIIKLQEENRELKILLKDVSNTLKNKGW